MSNDEAEIKIFQGFKFLFALMMHKLVEERNA